MIVGLDITETKGKIETIPKVSITPKNIIEIIKNIPFFLSLNKIKSHSFLYTLNISNQLLFLIP